MREHWENKLTSKDWQYRPNYLGLLYKSLAVAFRRIRFTSTSSTVHLSHTHHHEWMLDQVFLSADDTTIADAVCMWVVDRQVTPPGSCTRRLLELTERDRPLSPSLRWTIIQVVQQLWRPELNAVELEFVCLLNNLEISEHEMDEASWFWDSAVGLVGGVLCSPMGRWFLSSHYWLLLGNLISMGPDTLLINGDEQMETMKSLEEAQDWERFETWMVVVWCSWYYLEPAPIQDLERATLTLFRQRPSVVPIFEDLYEKGTRSPFPYPLFNKYEDEFRWICNQVRAEQPRSEPSS
jgi:hypothetical protein